MTFLFPLLHDCQDFFNIVVILLHVLAELGYALISHVNKKKM